MLSNYIIIVLNIVVVCKYTWHFQVHLNCNKDWCKKMRLTFLSMALVIRDWFLQFKVFLKAGQICYKTCSHSFFQKTNRCWDIFKNVWNKNFEKYKNCKKLQYHGRPGINPIFWLKCPMSARQMLFFASQGNKTLQKPSKIGPIEQFCTILSSIFKQVVGRQT